ncbi:MAG: response regulator [bacterium]|nr:response regulator [bacterium]
MSKKKVPLEKISKALRRGKKITGLEERVHYLEEVNRLTLDALDQAVRLGDFQTSINQMDSPDVILEKTRDRIRGLVPFEAVGFYLVDEEDSEFYLQECQPSKGSRYMRAEVEHFIENGTFAWAIREQRPLFVPTTDRKKKILLHVLTTVSRVRGMFVGVLTRGEMDVPLVSLSLMSIILRHSANALESFHLYRIIRGMNKNLEKKMEERTQELQNSREQLRHAQKMEALGRLAGGVAHDFNNILTAITIASEVSLRDPAVPEPINRNFKEILTAAERASNLTRQLLAVSRKQVIKPRVMDINRVVTNTHRMLTRLIRADIEIVLQPGKNLHAIKADPSQMEQVLINLAINAQHAIGENPNPDARKCISIHLKEVRLEAREVEQNIVSRPGLYLLICFSDTGVGMDAAVRHRIFEPFFTTKEEGKGTGLGMATVYGIIKQNRGGITVKSSPGKGTTFNIYWPCVEMKEKVPPKRQRQTRVTGGEETVMLVDDDDSIRHAVGKLLSSVGYHVLTAANGQEALEKTKNYEGTIKLLLTDITMPVMDGKQLAESLKRQLPGIKVIFTTGYINDRHSITDSLPPGSGFIQKPYSIIELTKIIRQSLDNEE